MSNGSFPKKQKKRALDEDLGFQEHLLVSFFLHALVCFMFLSKNNFSRAKFNNVKIKPENLKLKLCGGEKANVQS